MAENKITKLSDKPGKLYRVIIKELPSGEYLHEFTVGPNWYNNFKKENKL